MTDATEVARVAGATPETARTWREVARISWHELGRPDEALAAYDEALIAEWGMTAVHGTPLWDGSAAERTTIFRRGGAAEPMLGCAIHGAVMAIAGENVFGLRLTAAIAGAIGVGLLYLLLLEFLRPGAALGASWRSSVAMITVR